jgi:ethanolamine utilization protein EutA
MADALVTALTEEPAKAGPHDPVVSLWLTEPLGSLAKIDGAMFSGGVGEYVYGREERDFGDLGRRFGHAIRERLDAGRLPLPLLPAGECIRATALGASEYSVQLSGNTIYLSSPGELLPRKNLQVIQPRVKLGDTVDADAVAAAVRKHFLNFDIVEGDGEVAIAFRWKGEPSYPRIAGLARGVVQALPRTIAAGRPLFLILDGDVAQTLGAILKEELAVASEVLVLDGIALWDFDYIDLGRVRMPSFTVPVTIKSLVFHHEHRHQHHHHR